jgi:hypothetical protein
MSALAATAAVAAAALLARTTPPPRVPPHAVAYPSASAALEPFLRDAAGVVAFGEIHQDRRGPRTRSSLARFTDDVLPALAARASHLIVETWVTTGACGAVEARVTEDVARTTARPAATETEIVRLLRRAKELGVAPHVLSVSCDEYGFLVGGAAAPVDGAAALADGDATLVDYDRLLTLTRRHLARAIEQALALPRAPVRPLVLVYGGALHNDLYPDPALAAYAFGQSIYALTRGDYREVDLVVPELAARLPALRAEPWYAVWRRRAPSDPTATWAIVRSPASVVVVFPREAPRGGRQR